MSVVTVGAWCEKEVVNMKIKLSGGNLCECALLQDTYKKRAVDSSFAYFGACATHEVLILFFIDNINICIEYRISDRLQS